MNNSKLFQYVVLGLFIFFIIVGSILFATYRSTDTAETNINITIWGTLRAEDFSSFISKFFNENGIKYTVDYVERNSATFDQDLVEALASGDGPDAIILPEDLIVRYINKIYPIPYSTLSELEFKNTFIQEGELYLRSNGILALPFTVDPMVMYWNRDTFYNVGVIKPPATWAEISNLVSKMTIKDLAQNILRSTVALGEFRNVANAKEILSALMIQAGTPIVKTNSDGTLSSSLISNFDMKNSPIALSLQFFTNFSNPVKPEYSWNRSLQNSLDVFANGDLAIYFGFASEFIKIKEKNPNLNFDVALLPQVVGATTYSTFGRMLGFAIMRNSINPAGTYIVLNTLASAQAFPYWSNIFNIPSARNDMLGQIDNNAIKTVFNQSAIRSKGWLDPNKVETGKIFQEMVESYTTGRETLEAVINNASDKIDNLINIK